jgi:hypothetical protein
MKNFLEYIKKYGATAVLVAWLMHTNYRVAILESKLYSCLERNQFMQQYQKQNACILPKQLSYETEGNS